MFAQPALEIGAEITEVGGWSTPEAKPSSEINRSAVSSLMVISRVSKLASD